MQYNESWHDIIGHWLESLVHKNALLGSINFLQATASLKLLWPISSPYLQSCPWSRDPVEHIISTASHTAGRPQLCRNTADSSSQCCHQFHHQRFHTQTWKCFDTLQSKHCHTNTWHKHFLWEILSFWHWDNKYLQTCIQKWVGRILLNDQYCFHFRIRHGYKREQPQRGPRPV